MRALERMRLAYYLWRARAALKAGRVEAAEGFHEMMEEVVPGTQAATEFGAKLREAALARAARLVEEDPASAEHRGDYARALLAEDRTDEAAEQIQKGMELLKKDKNAKALEPHLCLVAGEVAFEQGDYRRALEMFDKGAMPGFPMAAVHYYRGLCRLGLGDKAGARRELALLVRMAHWAVPMRHRELMQEKRAAREP